MGYRSVVRVLGWKQGVPGVWQRTSGDVGRVGGVQECGGSPLDVDEGGILGCGRVRVF